MCNPVLAAVIGGGQAVLGHIGQVQAATQTNKNRLALYNAEKVRVQQRHAINIQNYYLRGVDAEETWADNTIEASLARQQQEMLLNEAIAESFRGMEGDYIKLQSDSRIVKYAERTGVTARRGRTAVRGALGRAQSARLAAVDRQHDRAVQVLHQIQSAKKVADRKADDMIGLEPERGPGPVKPKWDKGPSMLSLVVKTALGAYGILDINFNRFAREAGLVDFNFRDEDGKAWQDSIIFAAMNVGASSALIQTPPKRIRIRRK